MAKRGLKFPTVLTDDSKKARKEGAAFENMAPKDFLKKSQKLHVGKGDRQLIDHFKHSIEHRDPLGPLKLYEDGGQDGRHRATAAMELGVKNVPVVNFRKKKKKAGGSVYSQNLPPQLPISHEDPEATFRRLIEWSFAVAPLFGRTGHAGGGAVSDIETAINVAKNIDPNIINVIRNYASNLESSSGYDRGGYAEESKEIPSAASQVWESDLDRLHKKMKEVQEDEDKYKDGGSIVDRALDVISPLPKKRKKRDAA